MGCKNLAFHVVEPTFWKALHIRQELSLLFFSAPIEDLPFFHVFYVDNYIPVWIYLGPKLFLCMFLLLMLSNCFGMFNSQIK